MKRLYAAAIKYFKNKSGDLSIDEIEKKAHEVCEFYKKFKLFLKMFSIFSVFNDDEDDNKFFESLVIFASEGEYDPETAIDMAIDRYELARNEID